MSEIVDIPERGGEDRKDFFLVGATKHEFVPRFFNALEPGVKGVAPALVIRFEQEGLGLALVRIVILPPDKGGGPVGIVAQRLIIYDRGGGTVPFRGWLERLWAFQVTV